MRVWWFLLGVTLMCLGPWGCTRRPEDGSKLRIAYMARLTHAPALTGLSSGRLQKAVGPVNLQPRAFEVGNAIIEALYAGEIDAAFLGPGPAINGWMRSGRGDLRVVAGAGTGGARFVVRRGAGIKAAADLRGRKLASPQIASTQDIALRSYLKSEHLATTLEGGDIMVLPLRTPELRQAFASGQIDGAWVAEPLATILEVEHDGETFVDEAERWSHGEYLTTVLVVRTRFQEQHPEVVRRLVEAHVAEVDWVEQHRQEALTLCQAQMQAVLGKGLPERVAKAAWAHVGVSYEVMPAFLEQAAQQSHSLGFLPSANIDGLVDPAPLAAALARRQTSASIAATSP